MLNPTTSPSTKAPAAIARTRSSSSIFIPDFLEADRAWDAFRGRHMPHPGTLARQPPGQALDQCGAAQFLSDELLLEIPSDERAHCSQKHKGGNSHPNGGFESVIHVHREPPTNKVAGRDRL